MKSIVQVVDEVRMAVIQVELWEVLGVWVV
jgi:hypothetical protein